MLVTSIFSFSHIISKGLKTTFLSVGAECAAIPSSNGMIQVCETPDVDDTRICTIDCDGNDISLTLEGPVYYTCSKYGMWDRSERLAQFEYPACSGR